MMKNSWKYSVKSIVHFTIYSLFLLAVWRTYESTLLEIFDEWVLPYLSVFKANVWSTILFLVGVIIALYIFAYRNIISRHVYNAHTTLVVLWSVIILLYYRLDETYSYELLYGDIAYVDGLIGVGILYLLFALINYIRVRMAARVNKTPSDPSVPKLMLDRYISTLKEDELDWADEIKKFKDILKGLPKSHSLSIAINAKWGGGKTSFLHLLWSTIDTKEYEVVYFNPRESKSVHEIQEDFFQQIMAVLSKYDGRAEYNLKKYMAALQIIDDRSWIAKLLNVYVMLNKESYREKIKQICANLPVKIIIIVDDFDRLLPDEIVEVLKLIGSNASFSNFIFLTAYDKAKVNEVLENTLHESNAYYTDKYFDMEYALPIRPYGYIRDFFVKNIAAQLLLNDEDKESINRMMQDNEDIYRVYMPTLRDVKRVINQMMLDYPLVAGEVDLKEFIQVQLIKYKYPKEYYALSRKENLEINFSVTWDALFIKKEACESKELKSLDLQTMLFHTDDYPYQESLYRHIYEEQSFDNYFVNKLYGKLMIKEMKQLFEVDYDKMCKLIDKWLEDNQQIEDVVNYLQSFHMNELASKEHFEHYANAVAYIATKTGTQHGQMMLQRLLFLENLEESVAKYGIDLGEYKKQILSILCDVSIDPLLYELRHLHYFAMNHVMDNETELIKTNDIWPIIKTRFIHILESVDEQISDEDKLGYLYNCIDHLDQQRKIVLDKDCCNAYRKYLEKHPHYYVQQFVRLARESAISDFNSIGCEPFWNQIFNGEEDFYRFMKKSKDDGIENSIRVLNFMEIYAANDYAVIEFHHQGSVQEKIDADLDEEVDKLHRLQSLDKTYEDLLKDENMEGVKLRVELEMLLQKVIEIDLHIALREKLYKSLNEIVGFDKK